MRGTQFAQLTSFAAIAEHGSLVKAAVALEISTPTLSQALRALEERLGVRLVNRTTRSLALTEAGERLLAHIRPALAQLGAATEAINAFRDHPAGTLRLSVASLAGGVLIAGLPAFQAAYPDIALDISINDRRTDIVAGHFDAGIRPEWLIERDMIATRITPDTRALAMTSPEYLVRHARPLVPQDLQHHNCIRFRLPSGAIFGWSFEKNGTKLDILAEGSFITDDSDLVVAAVLGGMGISYGPEDYVTHLLASGRLVPLLEDWAPTFSGLYIYYSSRRQMPLPLKAFVEFFSGRLRRS